MVYFVDHGTPWRTKIMSETPIQWTDRSWGYQQGCIEESPGCSRCYAKRMAQRLAKNPKVPQYTEEIARWDGTMNLYVQGLMEPLLRKTGATWFPSMTDPFLSYDPTTKKGVPDEWIGLAFLVATLCPQHRFLMLTKRPERIFDWFNSTVYAELSEAIDRGAFFLQLLALLKNCGQEDAWDDIVAAVDKRDRADALTVFPLNNVLLGASVEDQIRSDKRMPVMHQLKQTGWFTFISAEPLLEEVNLHLDQYPVDWVIIGGESGHKARPFNLNWGRSLLKQCRDNNVKVFFKQMGANAVDSSPYIVGTAAESTNWKVNFKDKKGGDPEEWEEVFRVREMPDILVMQKDVIERSHLNS